MNRILLVVILLGLCRVAAAHDYYSSISHEITAGAVLGGVIGYQVDKDDGAIVGSILGALLGSHYRNSSDHYDRTRYSRIDEIQYRQNIQHRIETETRNIILAGDEIFEPGNAKLKPAASTKLNEIASLMKRYPRTIVHIDGHSDSSGRVYLNKVISLGRAESVAMGLVVRGIDRSRIKTAGYGETQPTTDNESSESQQLNRRVELFIEPVFNGEDLRRK